MMTIEAEVSTLSEGLWVIWLITKNSAGKEEICALTPSPYFFKLFYIYQTTDLEPAQPDFSTPPQDPLSQPIKFLQIVK
jgi:hypothetical protein